MKTTIIKTALVLSAIFSFFFSKAQWKDSASYKQAVIQYYKQQTTGLKTYKYLPNAYTQAEQDTMFTKAQAWKKENVDHPIVLNYYRLKKGTPAAEAKLRYLEDTASRQEYSEVLAKAAQRYAAENKTANQQRHIAPGLTTPRSKSGKMLNNDKEIGDKVLKNWKF
jgi:hypothetical protein